MTMLISILLKALKLAQFTVYEDWKIMYFDIEQFQTYLFYMPPD